MIKCGIVQAGSVSEVQQNIEKLKKYVTEAKGKVCYEINFLEC